MTERYLTEKEIKELLCASEEETIDEHEMPSDGDKKYDEVLPDPVI